MRIPLTLRLAAIFWATVVFGTGCRSMSVPNPISWTMSKVKDSKVEPPANMVCIWTPDVLVQSGKAPARGFGGRIYFYDQRQKVMSAEGQLIVYGYDDSKGPTGDDRMPERKFAFTAAQFQKHFSESQIGASYSVWLPWDAAGGEAKQITLVPVFTSTTGKIVMGQPTVTMLPGPPGEGNAINQIQTKQSSTGGVQQVSHAEGGSTKGSNVNWENVGGNDSIKMRTTTIDLPEPTAKRLSKPLTTPNATPGDARSATTQTDPNAAAQTLLDRWNQLQASNTAFQNSQRGAVTPNASGNQEAAATDADSQATKDSRPRSGPPPLQDRFARPKFPAPTLPGGQVVPSRAPIQPTPLESRFAPKPTP